MKSLLVASMLSCLAGCMVGEVIEDQGDIDVLHDDDPSMEDGEPRLNNRGWIIPAGIASITNAQNVAYTGPGAWNGGANCSGGLMAGTREVGDYLKANFPGINSYGGYVCRRNTANAAEMSVHGTGRAIDIMIPLKAGDANNAVGDQIANFLAQNAEKIGIQFIIWDRNSWNPSRSAPKLRTYTGPSPHIDHLHVELTPAGARRMTEWFSDTGNAPPPPASDTATVSASSLNLRSGPSTSYSVLTSMPSGSTVTVNQGPSNAWYNVTYNGTTGWCHGDYLDL